MDGTHCRPPRRTTHKPNEIGRYLDDLPQCTGELTNQAAAGTTRRPSNRGETVGRRLSMKDSPAAADTRSPAPVAGTPRADSHSPAAAVRSPAAAVHSPAPAVHSSRADSQNPAHIGLAGAV